jgi:hypothetical protein
MNPVYRRRFGVFGGLLVILLALAFAVSADVTCAGVADGFADR